MNLNLKVKFHLVTLLRPIAAAKYIPTQPNHTEGVKLVIFRWFVAMTNHQILAYDSPEKSNAGIKIKVEKLHSRRLIGWTTGPGDMWLVKHRPIYTHTRTCIHTYITAKKTANKSCPSLYLCDASIYRRYVTVSNSFWSVVCKTIRTDRVRSYVYNLMNNWISVTRTVREAVRAWHHR